MTHGRRQSVMVVDDNEQVRAYILRALDLGGFRATGAADGTAALEHLDRDPDAAELLLVDQRMPGMSGDELIAEVRRRRPQQRILRILGDSGDARSPDAFTATLSKPFRPDQLIDAVTRMLGPA